MGHKNSFQSCICIFSGCQRYLCMCTSCFVSKWTVHLSSIHTYNMKWREGKITKNIGHNKLFETERIICEVFGFSLCAEDRWSGTCAVLQQNASHSCKLVHVFWQSEMEQAPGNSLFFGTIWQSETFSFTHQPHAAVLVVIKLRLGINIHAKWKY